MGGVIDAKFLDGPLPRRPVAFTVPEMRWAMERLRNRSLEKMVHGVFLHDDVVTENSMTLDVIKFLKAEWPQLLPMTNAGLQGPDTLYEQRQPLMIPEEYMLSGATTNATMGTAEEARAALMM